MAPNNPHDLTYRLKVHILSAPWIARRAKNDTASVDVAQRHHRLAQVARLAALPEVGQLAAVGPLREKAENLAHPIFNKFPVVFGVRRGSREAGSPGLRYLWLPEQIPSRRELRPDFLPHDGRPMS